MNSELIREVQFTMIRNVFVAFTIWQCVIEVLFFSRFVKLELIVFALYPRGIKHRQFG